MPPSGAIKHQKWTNENAQTSGNNKSNHSLLSIMSNLLI